jgi:hypothetical protein
MLKEIVRVQNDGGKILIGNIPVEIDKRFTSNQELTFATSGQSVLNYVVEPDNASTKDDIKKTDRITGGNFQPDTFSDTFSAPGINSSYTFSSPIVQ